MCTAASTSLQTQAHRNRPRPAAQRPVTTPCTHPFRAHHPRYSSSTPSSTTNNTTEPADPAPTTNATPEWLQQVLSHQQLYQTVPSTDVSKTSEEGTEGESRRGKDVLGLSVDDGRLLLVGEGGRLTDEGLEEMIELVKEWDSSECLTIMFGKADQQSPVFCAGEDLQYIAENIRAGTEEGLHKVLRLIEKQAQLTHLFATLDTPVVSVMDGLTAGGGLALSIQSPIRIATENTEVCFSPVPQGPLGEDNEASSISVPFSMSPGMSFFAARIPDGERMGRYLALTGERLKGMEVALCGIATHFVPASRIPALIERLCELDTSDLQAVDKAIEEYAGAAPSVNDWSNWRLGGEAREIIDRCFNFDTLAEIIKALEKEGSGFFGQKKDGFAAGTLEKIRRQSTTYLKVRLEQLVQAAKLDIASSLRMDYRVACGMLSHHDFLLALESLSKSSATASESSSSIAWSPTLDEVLEGKKLSDAEVKTMYFQDADAEGEKSATATDIETPKSFHLSLFNDRTFDQYMFRTATMFPKDEDVRKIVSGKIMLRFPGLLQTISLSCGSCLGKIILSSEVC
ncbi:hypothetical protein HK102_007893 [Quaeritorhiza haematococci]|nr:hypothetical protein HK102_007893 [Quaeritorhiza haematococci]